MNFWSGSCRWSAREWSRWRRGRSMTLCPCTRTARIGSGHGSEGCAGRAKVSDSFWRLYFVVVVDDEPVGMQDLIGTNFSAFRTVETFSWLGPDVRGRGLGKEMRQAALQLAFAGLGARQADSGAFIDNHASNRVSRALGYQPNGVDWSTRRGDAAEINRWRLTRDTWSSGRRDDIELIGVAECLPVLGIRDLGDR